jgi:hypothetical protein
MKASTRTDPKCLKLVTEFLNLKASTHSVRANGDVEQMRHRRIVKIARVRHVELAINELFRAPPKEETILDSKFWL